MSELKTVDEARALAVALCAPLPTEPVGIDQACGRVLREPIVAADDVPAWPTSMMDGFALRAADGTSLTIVGESAAGRPRRDTLEHGQAVAISTGALLPPGADAVVPVEDVEVIGTTLRLRAPTKYGAFVRMVGAELRVGEGLMAPGRVLDAPAVALLAMQGRAQVTVSRRPRVAILSTGAEVRGLGEALGPGDVYDANAPALSALVASAGGEVVTRRLVADDRDATVAALRDLTGVDLVLVSGGVSVGPHDHVRPAIEALGGSILLWRVAMKPGKPLVLARIGDTPIVGLPGNPVSAQVGFLLFVRTMLRRLLGAEPVDDAVLVEVALAAPLSITTDRPTYLRARVHAELGRLVAVISARQGSAALTSMLDSNALVRIGPGTRELPSGAALPARLYGAIARAV